MSHKSTHPRKSDVEATTWLLPEQVKTMRDVCLTEQFHPSRQDRNEVIVALLYDLGLRAQELVGLNVEDIDLKSDPVTVYLSSDIQKGSPPPATREIGRWGDLGTTRSLRRYLRDRDRDTSALIPTRSSDRMTPRSLRRLINRIAVAADVSPRVASGGYGEPEDVTPHTLRHSVAYRIIQKMNGRLEDVQLRLRHANRATTDQIYSHLIPR